MNQEIFDDKNQKVNKYYFLMVVNHQPLWLILTNA